MNADDQHAATAFAKCVTDLAKVSQTWTADDIATAKTVAEVVKARQWKRAKQHRRK